MNHPTEACRPHRRRLFAVASLVAGCLAAVAVAAPGDRAPATPVSNPPQPANGGGQGPAGQGSFGSRMLPTGITTPSTTIKLGFDIRGVVEKVQVKDNDPVKVGQPIISLLDTEERANLESLRLKADTSLAVAEAQQTFNVKKIDYERKKYVYTQTPSGSAELEMKQAEAEMNIAQIRIDTAKHEGDIAKAQADAQEARVNRMGKVSPIDGVIRQVIVKPGEQVDETKPVVEIVDLDPLYVEVTLVDRPTVQRLKLGDKLRVRYPGENDWREATVDRIDPVADASAGTQPFRLSLPNPENRDAGTRVEIQLPNGVAAAQ